MGADFQTLSDVVGGNVALVAAYLALYVAFTLASYARTLSITRR